MYRIRLTTGQEQVYPSIQELTAGVQRGEVTAEAEIYHQRTERWLSIESHPHFRMALEGSTATRTSRLKFTRPSAPAPTSAVRPTPAAQKPDQGDLEELNRLLVLLDPLPTPAQRAEPPKPVVQSPPDLTLVRPDPSASADPEPVFGTMLRLEDLEPMPKPLELQLSPTVPEPAVAPEPARHPILDLASNDLGLPVEIHLDEIPVPQGRESVTHPEAVVPVLESVQLPAEDVQPVTAAPAPVFAPIAPASHEQPEVSSHDTAVPAVPSGRRRRPMLYVASAAIIAAVVYFLAAGGSEDEQGMVTLASATAPAAATIATAPATALDSTEVTPASTVGFPMPAAGRAADEPTATKAAAARDSAAQASLLPSAPTIDLGIGGTDQVVAGAAAAPRTSAGSGSQLARSYARSYQTLQTEFAGQMERSGMVRLFSQTQLTTADGLSGARRALEAATSAVRQYHAGEGSIERAFQDSARAMERSGATPAELRDWMTHASLKESREAADEGARLLGQIDAVFALLQAQSGRYRIEGSTVRFQDSNAAARYAELQGWITRRLEHWSGQPASSVPVTVQPILEGIGLTRLPLSR